MPSRTEGSSSTIEITGFIGNTASKIKIEASAPSHQVHHAGGGIFSEYVRYSTACEELS